MGMMVFSNIALPITLGVIGMIILLILITSYICYSMIFKREKKKSNEQYPLPDGKEYLAYKDELISMMKYVDDLPYKEASITSFDGLKLYGRYYECDPNAPIEILFHGYKGDSRRDLSGGVIRCFKVNHNVLLVDHRASGKSEGKVISFGVNESQDCLKWIDYILQNINKDAKIILSGVSMGAATVLIASSFELPKNVIGVLADCGYSSTEAIIKKVIKEMKLPPNLLIPFVKLGALLFGHFKVDKYCPIESVKNAKVPIIYYHGDTDLFVPYEMSIENFNATKSISKMVTIENAGHGLCFLIDKEKYVKELIEFFDKIQ